MPIVERFFSRLEQETESVIPSPKPFLEFSQHPAILVLGDPGSGKTTSFLQAASQEPNAEFVSVRDFLVLREDHWEGKTLYLDGLDEQQTRNEDGRTALDRIRRKLDELKRPRFRLSCRSADWYGQSEEERLRVVSPDGTLVVLRLEPLSDENVVSIAADIFPEPEEFLSQAQQRNIDPLLRNPQTLKMILDVIQDGVWPETRAELYQKGCDRLLQETNRPHEQGQTAYIPTDRLLNAAGYLCAVHLCGGTKGFRLFTKDAEKDYPFIGEMRYEHADLGAVVRRRAFRADGFGRVTPIHRTIAEYLAAQFLVDCLRAGLPIKRVLALLTGYDGGTLSEFRGIYAWLACLYEEEAAMLIKRDPPGLILYGDAAILSPSGKKILIHSLRDVAHGNPAFLEDYWFGQPFGALVSPELETLFKGILQDPNESPNFLLCILDAIRHAPPLPELGDPLMQIVRDHTRSSGVRALALAAFLRVCLAEREKQRKLLYDIQEGQVSDKNCELRGNLLDALYPDTIGPDEIAKYIVEPVERQVNLYTMFLVQDLVGRTHPPDLPKLLLGINTTTLSDSQNQHFWESFMGTLILKLLQHHGETMPAAQLYDCLGKALDQDGHPMVSQDEKRAVHDWLEEHPEVVSQLFEHWVYTTPFERPQLEVARFWERLYNIASPLGFYRRLVQLAESEGDPARAEFLFSETVRGSVHLQRADGLTLEELFEFTDRNPKFDGLLQMHLCCHIPLWSREQTLHQKLQMDLESTERTYRVQQLTGQLDAIRLGTATNALIYLARAYFGTLLGVDRECSPKDRIIKFTTPDIAEAAMKGFVEAFRTIDIPNPRMIGELEVEGKEYPVGFPVLAGLDVLADRSLDDVMSLPEPTLQSALAFHYANWTEGDRGWAKCLIEKFPDLAAEALSAFWRPQLALNFEQIHSLHDLGHTELMSPIAERVSLTLLREFPSCFEANLELLLHAAIRHAEPDEFLAFARQVLTDQVLAIGKNRTLWSAAAFILKPTEFQGQLAQQIGEDAEQAARLVSFLCPTFELHPPIMHTLSVDALAPLISITGRIFHQHTLVRSGIHRLGVDPTQKASEALAQLYGNPDLLPWRDQIRSVQERQARLRREGTFKYPSVEKVIETLRQGGPANPMDLQALICSDLHAIRTDLQDGSTDGWKKMWNVDQNGKPVNPRPENDCRDRLLEELRPKLLKIDLEAEREGNYKEDKRADIKVIRGAMNVPIEIKRHHHRDLWTAPSEQLNKLYLRDPGTAGRGIYVVFWFGITPGRGLPRPPNGIPRPRTPSELEDALRQVLPDRSKELIEIIVINCEGPEPDQK